MITLLLFAAAPALASPSFEPVEETLTDGVLDWTGLRLLASASSDRQVGAWSDRAVQEQDALDRLAPRILGLAPQVRVTADLSAGDLLNAGDELSHRIAEGLSEWRVEETRYRSKSGVEMDAVLDLQIWLRPALVSMAKAGNPPPPPTGATGLVVDVRGFEFQPCLVPSLMGGPEETLFDTRALSEETVRRGPPVIFVVDPADPRAIARAGEAPIFARAVAVDGCRVTLLPVDADVARAHPDLSAIGALGRVVLVVDP